MKLSFDKKMLMNDIVNMQFDAILTQSAPSSNANDNQTSQSNDEYEIFKFRIVSAVVIWGLGFPVDYTEPGVVEKATSKFARTLYANHEMDVKSWFGLVKNPVYNTETTPPGVDGEFHLDKTLSNSKDIIRGVKTGAISRCSATMQTRWKQSHPEMARYEFVDCLGKIVDGSLVRIIITEIIEVMEVSLVFWGADHTAIKQDLKINSNMEENMSLEELLKMLSQTLNKELTVKDVEPEIKNLLIQKKDLETQVNNLLPFKTFKEKLVTEQRTKTLGLLETTKQNNQLYALHKTTIEAADYESLVQISNELEKNFTFMCASCGGKLERRSTFESIPDGDSDKKAKYKSTGLK